MAHSQTKDSRVDVVSRAYPFPASPTDLSYHCSTLYITHTELKQEPGNILLRCWMNCVHELIHTYAENFFLMSQYRNEIYPNMQYVWIQIKFVVKNNWAYQPDCFFAWVIYSSEETDQSEQVRKKPSALGHVSKIESVCVRISLD